MALLDYLLGGAAGGFEGYERRKAKELQAQKDEEDRQIKQLAMLNQLGFSPTGLVRETPDAAAQNIVGDIKKAAPMPKFDSTLNRAFGAAQQRDFGVAEKPTGALTTPVSLALDSSKIGQFERAKGMQPAGPEMQVNTPLGRMGFTRETEEQKKAKADAEFEKTIAGFSEEEKRVARLVRAGVPGNVLQSMMSPREAKQPWAKEGFATEKEYLEYKRRESAATRAPKDKEGGPRFGEISSLRKEFNVESRPYKTVNDALKIIESLGTKPNPTPQDLQALTYAFVKVQDPTSVVRETEYANAERAIALADRVGSLGTRIVQGQRLSPTQRRDMVNTARALRVEAMARYGALADSYEQLAGSFGMAPRAIVPNRLDRDVVGTKDTQPSGGAASQGRPNAMSILGATTRRK